MATCSSGAMRVWAAAAVFFAAGRAQAFGIWGGFSWTSEAVDSTPMHDPGGESAIAFDGSGRPHIAYTERIDGDLKYAHKNAGGTWVIETIDGSVLSGSGLALALDAAGMAHVSYHRSADTVSMGDLLVAERHCAGADTGCGWTLTTLATATHSPFLVGNTGIAVDHSGNVHVTFVDNANGELRYGKHDSSGWWTLPVTPLASGTASIAVDGNDLPHLAFSDQDSHAQRYAHVACVFILCGWSFEPIDAGDHGVIRLDGAGHAHVAYQRGADVRYARRPCDPTATGCTWTSELVSAGAGPLAGPSLAVTSAGAPHVSFYGTTVRDVRHGWRSRFGWTTERADLLGSGFGTTSIALDAAGNPHISYHDSFNNHLRHATGVFTPPVLTMFQTANLGALAAP